MIPRVGVVLLVICSLVVADEARLKSDVAALKAGRVPTDGPGLVTYFKKRTIAEEDRTKIATLIQQLGAEEYAAREKATNDLIDLGPRGRAQLTQALKDPDLEVRKRAKAILTHLGPPVDEHRYTAPAARVLAQRKPDGAAKALLDFLPCIDEANVAAEVAEAVIELALGKDGKPDADVVLALRDRAAMKRAAAGCALARCSDKEHRALTYGLLKDTDFGVRRRVAVALLEARDKTAVPALIALVAAPSSEDAGAAEEALNQIAGEKAPPPPDTETVKARETYQRSWESWWKDHEDKLDLTKIDLNAVGSGFTLVAMVDVTKTNIGSVLELDGRGKVRWKIDNVNYPVHASMTRRDRVLICEYYGGRVTERDLKGNVTWEKRIPNPLQAERLPNGNTFIVTRNRLLEVDRDGAEVKAINRVGEVMVAAYRHKDGTKYVTLATNGNCATLNSAGNQISSFQVGFLSAGIGFRPHFLASGGIVVPIYSQGKVKEFDATGRVVGELNAYQPSAVVRLPNGNTLVASRIKSRIVELDKTGKEVAVRDVEQRVTFLDRR